MRRNLPLLTTLATLAFALAAPAAQAVVAPPQILASWVTTVSASSANLRAEINPRELPTSYRFEYTTEADFLANEFDNALRVPAGPEAQIASGDSPVAVVQHPNGLELDTAYRFRVVATNSEDEVVGPTRSLRTDESTPVFSLPDNRRWEMVSPTEKNGGEIQGFGAVFAGGVLQAAVQGGAVTYTSTSSFGAPPGSPGASQYVSTRSGSSWTTDNVTTPMLSGSYPESPTSGVPFQLFSDALDGGLVSNGRRCRSSAPEACPVENPPLPGSGAEAGYRNYYVRSSDGSYHAVLTSADISDLQLGPAGFEVAFAGATPDLGHIVISTCAALTQGSTEVPGSPGECNEAKQNLYEKSGSELRQINTTPGAALAAQGRAISTDGSRVYWTNGANLYLREGAVNKQVDESKGGGGTFETAGSDGSIAYFSKASHLYRYLVAGGAVEDLTPSGGLKGVLGTSADGAYVYYVTVAGLFLEHGGTVTPIASEVAEDSYPPTTGTARVSDDGTHLAFVSSATDLAPYDNRNATSGEPEPEVYLFTAPGAPGAGIVCASCNPTGERPIGAAALRGASANGTGPFAPHSYKPRALSTSGDRLFFESADALVVQDTNDDRDVYEWEAPGAGTCMRPSGCIGLISSGRTAPSTFVDASADGADAYFLTAATLVTADPGVVDVYDARVDGGFPDPAKGIPCFGDACQPLPPEPEDPTPGTLRLKKSGNLPPPVPKKPLRCKKNQVKRFGKCKKKKPDKRAHKKRSHR
jgi:hypothetical protein